MKISGFTFVRNATRLFFPIRESIESILPLVEEFIVLYSKGDEGDRTLEEIQKINSPKIRIIESDWDRDKYPHNTVYAHETDKAKDHCTGDWLFYLQSDEAVHENELEKIREACAYYLDDVEVEGLLFEFRHFWGDFDHYFKAHNWYPREIRIIRNKKEIHSWKDAQSFRVFDSFNYTFQDYLRRKGTRKLKVARIYCHIHHYGWVRPPRVMTQKTQTADPELGPRLKETEFDYGPLNKLKKYNGTHPKSIIPWIEKIFDWSDQLQYEGGRKKSRPMYKHERLKYRILSFLENNFLNGRQIGGFKNYEIIRNFESPNHSATRS